MCTCRIKLFSVYKLFEKKEGQKNSIIRCFISMQVIPSISYPQIRVWLGQPLLIRPTFSHGNDYRLSLTLMLSVLTIFIEKGNMGVNNKYFPVCAVLVGGICAKGQKVDSFCFSAWDRFGLLTARKCEKLNQPKPRTEVRE